MASDAVTDGSNCSSGDFETNWRVGAGSLKRTIVLESSSEDSPLADSSPDSVCDASTPLVLKPEVADSGPCEIKRGLGVLLWKTGIKLVVELFQFGAQASTHEFMQEI